MVFLNIIKKGNKVVGYTVVYTWFFCVVVVVVFFFFLPALEDPGGLDPAGSEAEAEATALLASSSMSSSRDFELCLMAAADEGG